MQMQHEILGEVSFNSIHIVDYTVQLTNNLWTWRSANTQTVVAQMQRIMQARM